jgi:hypothetical protein
MLLALMGHLKLALRDYTDLIRSLPENGLTAVALLRNETLLFRDERLAIYYAPVDYVNTRARLAVVGITPGWQQMEIAYRAARQALLSGATAEEAQRSAKAQACFAGAMRRNLIAMLDELGAAPMLGVKSVAEAFDAKSELLHATSAVCYPVFVSGKNYTGHSPKLLEHPVLREFITEGLAPELAGVPNSLIVPLGECVQAALMFLISQGRLNSARCLMGFPHPSGANGHRVRQFRQHQDHMREVVRGWERLHS